MLGLLTVVASLVVEQGSRAPGAEVVVLWFSCSMACGIFLAHRTEPMSPALAGKFLMTGPPGMS